MNKFDSYKVSAVIAAILVLVLFFYYPAAAEIPSNDDWASPLEITSLPFEGTYDTSEATVIYYEPNPGCNYSTIQATVWFLFTPAISTQVNLTATGSYTTIVGVYTGSIYDEGGPTQVACGINPNPMTITLNAGTPYLIQVGAVAEGGYPPPGGYGGTLYFSLQTFGVPSAIIYVDANANGGNDGSSWTDAFMDLQTALDAVSYGYHIWVAEGTYKPTREVIPGDPRSAAFQMKNGVAIYGGFAGTETILEERDWKGHETILSCDLNGDDTPDFVNNSENCYHVVYNPYGLGLDSSAILDGFTITGGNANGESPHYYGGGMYNDYPSQPTLSNLIFSGNSARWYGGGLYNYSTAPVITNVTFTGNRAHQGGGMVSYFERPVLINCAFINNEAEEGGGLYNLGIPLLNNCVFLGNSAIRGGAIFNVFSEPTLTNISIFGNSAEEGGAIYNYGASPIVTNSILWGNTPDEVSNLGNDSNPAITYSDIQGGYAGEGNIDADPLLVDASNGDFHLSPGSPAIDAGNNDASNLPTYDFEGDPRILDGNEDGIATTDMGVDEVVILPANDNFANATVIPALPYTVTPANPFLATLEPDEPIPGCASGADPGDTLWYAITPAETSDFVLNLESDQSVLAAIYTGFSNEARIFETCSAGLNMLTLDAGITYYVQIGTLWQEQDWWVIFSLDILRDPVVSFEYKQLRGYELPTVYFNNTSYDPSGLTCWDSVSWDFGDGTNSSEWSSTHTYASAGDYLVTLSLTTCDGRSGSAQQWITALALTDIIYVDTGATGANNGISWEDAYTELQSALDEAVIGDKIWVAEGTYKSTREFSPGDPRSAAFQMKNGVAIYGGFAGNETTLEERDWVTHPTILSGDIGVEGDTSDNSYHVFYHPEGTNMDSNAILDGFTITDGNANGADPNNCGGGMYNNFYSSPTLNNITFSDNQAYFGGGMYNIYSDPTLTNVTYSSNRAYYSGGGMYNSGGSIFLTEVTFSNNTADDYGGGMANYHLTLTLSVVTFSGNQAYYGGGIYNMGSDPSLRDINFSNNSATLGGGMHNDEGSSPNLTDVTFSGNAASVGGGMHNRKYSSPTLTNVTFLGNTASDGGGMHNGYYSRPTLTNVTFFGNTAASGGGGMCNKDYSSPTLTNVTFSGNTAGYFRGGAIYNYNSTPVLTNSILWGNTPDQIFDVSSTLTITYSDVQGGYVGEGNIDATPLFVDAANGDFHLSPSSPAIDAGNNAAPNLPELDFEGDPRILDGNYDGVATTDMGVDEVVAPPLVIFYVDADANGANDGSSWADAFTELQPALDAAQPGNQIWVAAGIYLPTVEHGGSGNHYLSFQMKNGVAIYGGFDGSESNRLERDWVTNVTILSGDLKGNDKPGFVKNDENSYHVFYHPAELVLDDSAILDGVTITGGNANDSSLHIHGGGMLNIGASPTLANITFTGNWAYDGGGLSNKDSSSPILVNCTFEGNYAAWSGGGMHNFASSPTLVNCTVSENSAGINGGGMLNISASPALINSIFLNNSAVEYGGGLYNFISNPVLTNCTFSGNKAASGGGIFNSDSSPVLTNSILWGDAPNELDGINGLPVVTYSDIRGGYAGEGNIDADPRFVNPDNGDYHLKPRSMCIDSGNNAAPNLPEADFEGDVRILDGNFDGIATVDMGVDEAYFETQPAPITIYVDVKAHGAEDGTSWKDAYLLLHPALATALPGDQVWVAKGTYQPTKQYILGDPRSASFQLRNGVAVYGGFSGKERSLDERNLVRNVTVLSGDLNGDDAPDFKNNGENSYHVFYHPAEISLNGSAILDGFIIRGGNASSESPHNNGGGMYNVNSSPTVKNCLFESNHATYGGGMYNNFSSPMLMSCTFVNNRGNDGGGMYNINYSRPELTNVAFRDNHVFWGGGGMYNISRSYPKLADCTFESNSAGTYGGGLFNDYSSPVLTNCTFARNTASQTGGGIFNIYYSNPYLVNCTFSQNMAQSSGGALDNYHYSSPYVANSILWGDTPNEISDNYSTPTVIHSNIQGGYSGTGNINADPLFLDAANGNFHLWTGSPCIDSGYNYASYLPAFDFEGDARKLDGNEDGIVTVDMGVDEFQLPLMVTIDVKPGNSANVIRLSSKSPLPVAILTTDAFDASSVVPETVYFERAAAERWEMTDVDQDGDLDLLLYFEVAALDLEAGDTQAILIGKTSAGISIMGTDMVKVIP